MTRHSTTASPITPAGDDEELAEIATMLVTPEMSAQDREDVRSTLHDRAVDFLKALHDEQAAAAAAGPAAMDPLAEAIRKSLIKIDKEVADLQKKVAKYGTRFRAMEVAPQVTNAMAPRIIPAMAASPTDPVTAQQAVQIAIARNVLAMHVLYRAPGRGTLAQKIGADPLGGLALGVARMIAELRGVEAVTHSKAGAAVGVVQALYTYAVGPDRDVPDDRIQRFMRGAVKTVREPADRQAATEASAVRALRQQIMKPIR